MKGNDSDSDQPAKRKRSKATSSRSKVFKKTETFSAEELNLRVDLHPLSHYVYDRDNLVDQLFSILSAEEIQKMIPDTLQGYSLTEIRERVTVESKKFNDPEILQIIQDAVHNISNPGEIGATTGENVEQSVVIDEASANNSIKGPDTLQLCIEQEEIDSLIGPSTKLASEESNQKANIPVALQAEGKKDDQPLPSTEADRFSKKDEIGELSGVGTEWVSSLAKSQLEILELEMRARAIRSLMKAQGMPDPDDDSEKDNEHEANVELQLPETGEGNDLEETGDSGGSSSESECDTCVSNDDIREDVSDKSGSDVEAREKDSEKPMDCDEGVGMVVGPEVLEENPNMVELLDQDVDKPAIENPDIEQVEEISMALEEQVDEVISMMLLKVVSDEIETRKKRERRERRNLRLKQAKIMESDIEEGQIMEDSNSDMSD